MATTTTNYGFDIPQSTDLVKDGATAIATLGQDIDTSIYTALAGNKSGLVLLNTTSFSGVSSISAPASTFSATYEIYRIVVDIQAAATQGDLKLRMRASGTDTTGSVYSYNLVFLANSSQTTYNYIASTGNTTSATIGVVSASQEGMNIIDILNPFASLNTAWLAQGNSLGAVDTMTTMGGGRVNDTTSYDSITLFNSAGGNIAGKLRIYGVNQ